MPPKYQCSVKGCTDVHSSRHRLPNYQTKENLFREWSLRIGRLEYIENPILGGYACVCGSHFANASKRLGGLRVNALPTLNLPEIGQFPDLPRCKEQRKTRVDRGSKIHVPLISTLISYDPVHDHNYFLKECSVLPSLGPSSVPDAAKRVIEDYEGSCSTYCDAVQDHNYINQEQNVIPGTSSVIVAAEGVLGYNEGHTAAAVAGKRKIRELEHKVFPEPSSVVGAIKKVLKGYKEHNVFPGHGTAAVAGEREIGELEDDEERNVFPGPSGVVVAKKVTKDGIEHHVFPGPKGVLFTAKKVLKGFEENNVIPGPSGVAVPARMIEKVFGGYILLPEPKNMAVPRKKVSEDDIERNVFPGPSGVAVAGKRVLNGHKDISVPVGPGSSISVATRKKGGYIRKTKKPSVEELALKKQKLQSIISEARSQLQYVQRKKNCTVKERFAIATSFRDTSRLEDSFSSLKSILTKFILPKATLLYQKYSEAEKTLALRLYNGGPRCYPFLAKIFTLPTHKTLSNILDSISLKPGINQNLFERLEKKVDSMEDIQKYCILMFDEMSISPHLHFNERSGIIEGFEDNGNVRRNKFADHALVLMVKGLTVPYKQPVFFSFSEGGTNYLDLKEILRTVLGKLLDCGLKPVATVCDQGTVNRRVVKALLEDTQTSCISDETEYKGGYFMVNENMIFPLFDAPHLLKSVRNNLLDKDLIFFEDEIKKLASWENLVSAYNLVQAETFKRMYGVTDKHIIPEKINKMKIKFASQVFSDKVSAALETLNHLRPEGFAKNPLETARVLQFYGALFASFNGISVRPKGGKKYCVALSNDSPHIQLWNESLKIMNTMKYVHQTTGANIRTLTPVIDNWIFSIQGIIKLWNFLEDCGFKHLKCGYLNLVPLENFFRSIRSYAVRIPSPSLFMAAYKSLMICDFLLSAPSPGTNNCGADDSSTPYNVADIFAQSTSSTLISNVTSLPFVTIPEIDAQFAEICSSFSMQTSSTDFYIGFLFKGVLKTIRRCEECKSSCVGDPHDPINSFKLIPEIHVAGKLYPSKKFSLRALEIRYVVEYVLKHNCESVHLVHIINETILKYVSFDWIHCQRHKKYLTESFVKLTVPSIIRAWCTNVNTKLCGNFKKPYDGPDPMLKMAVQHYLKSAKCKNKMILK